MLNGNTSFLKFFMTIYNGFKYTMVVVYDDIHPYIYICFFILHMLLYYHIIIS